MRIIGGKARGRRVKTFRGRALRPTAARVKEALFDILPHDLSGRRVLDLFAGSGNLSLEALSRGAAEAVLVDASRNAARVMRENLRRLGFEEKASVWTTAVVPSVRALARQGRKFDLIFLDPPYEKGIVGSAMRALGEADLLEPHGTVVVERSVRETIDPRYGKLELYDERRYGTTVLSFFGNKPS
ncbi:MAG TPA: 16S rRNA (guanine(966)-N(2))-methyltransferase RsmD [Candidatus Acidoferrales bacterium]|nr:16S rRNA (guanine(966)-N(2))-methyltransferase RsmD [Candidatus Acidoferrales bacterium]